MTFLLEQPVPIAVAGILGLAATLAALLKTGLFRLLYVAAAVVAVTLGLLLVESKIVTPKEEIEQVLQQIARDLESNDASKILAHIASQSPGVRSAAEQSLQRVEIHRVTVKRNLHVTFPPGSDSLATASFNAVVIGSERRGVIRNQTAPWFFVVKFEKQSGAWRVADYERHPPQKGLER